MIDTKALAKLYRDLRLEEIHLQHLLEDLEGRKFFLAPDAGWEGKNEEARKLTAEKAFAADEICQKLRGMARDNEITIARLTGDLQALEAERRAYEWGVREQIVLALRGVLPADTSEHVDNRAFDDGLAMAFEDGVIAELAAAAEGAVVTEIDPIEEIEAQAYDLFTPSADELLQLQPADVIDDEIPF